MPVAAYTSRRPASIVGDDQIALPDGPYSVTPALLTPRGRGSSAMVYVFHTTRPVSISSADTLPRNVQQAYSGSSLSTSSYDDSGT
ncbi:MAG: hypothetical protein F4057_03995 [Acidobacteria bacterium]|nr:hypothetical protein [Acidobacteriota bacterium]